MDVDIVAWVLLIIFHTMYNAITGMLQLSYAIGVAEPLSIFVSSYSTGVKTDAELLAIVKENFDLRPGKIVK